MLEPKPDAPTVVCVGGKAGSVRGVCARIKRCGYNTIGVITDIKPDCTLPLISTLAPDAIIVSNDLPEADAREFGKMLHELDPDVRILLLEDEHGTSLTSNASSDNGSSEQHDVLHRLAELLKANA